jgi:hypothetical protein
MYRISVKWDEQSALHSAESIAAACKLDHAIDWLIAFEF